AGPWPGPRQAPARAVSPSSDPGEPLGLRGIAAADRVEVQRLQLGGDRPASAVADFAIVEFADRRDFGCGSGEERFVGAIDLVAQDSPLVHLETLLAGKRH